MGKEALFEKFGEFDSAEEINRAAKAQLEQGDNEAVKLIALENGIDELDAEDFISGDLPELCTELSAAFGKLEIEKTYLDIKDMTYGSWVAAIQIMLSENPELCRAYRRKEKRLAVILAMATVKCSKTRTNAPSGIVEEAKKLDSSIPSPLPMGAISIGDFKQLVREYYIHGNTKV